MINLILDMTITKASTLIITSPLKVPVNKFNYNVFLLKRNQNMRSWPGAHVFPGGKLDDPNDLTPKWLDVFFNKEQNLSFKKNPNLLTKEFKEFINNNSIGVSFDKSSDAFKLPSEISYRLCAIRETFEETGLLLAHEKSLINSAKFFEKSNQLTQVYDKNQAELQKWQKKVKRDSGEFLNMFMEMNLVPDLLGLHEWSNWVTPSFEKFRFNTVFFICFLKSAPNMSNICLDSTEIESINVIFLSLFIHHILYLRLKNF